ncbi:holo-ACP synthase [Litorilituus lipolyticus]|uniref:Holo-[acyl-carrier-protein] synthase n=1 Tax=Litorilituus lipolyticus TaxID=2491017 RepID=A0A502KXR7_9GAMM|nr:holo-ACP synthase [Litorilituus lipolyticus]TPH16570.1 holo-ACP synthase [Litorilituus lipolyticus]
MSVVGLGTDIIEVNRIADMKDAMRERLAKRVLTPCEYKRYEEASTTIANAFLAKRWAGKEAAAKALGTGIADGVSFQHFTIVSLDNGKPVLELTDRALTIAQSLGATHWHISLADETHYATATVILSK